MQLARVVHGRKEPGINPGASALGAYWCFDQQHRPPHQSASQAQIADLHAEHKADPYHHKLHLGFHTLDPWSME